MDDPTVERTPGGLRIDRLMTLLPTVAELRPLLDLLVGASRPDPARRWSGSGELGSAGDRLVDEGALAERIERLADEEARRLAALFRRTGEVVGHLARGDGEAASRELLAQGESEERAGRLDEASAWYLAAHRLARDAWGPLVPGALRRAARVDRALGRLEEAGRRYEEALSAAEAAGALDDAVVAAIGRGNVEVDRGRWAAAERWYRRALALLGDEERPGRSRWQVAQNLAIVSRRSGDLAAAREWLARARAWSEGSGDPHAAVEVTNGWGQLFLAEGNARAAELHFRQALEVAEEPKARVTVGVNLGEALLAQGRDLEAGEKAREAEAIALAHAVVGKLPEVYRLLAEVARARGEPDGFVLLERALSLIRERRLPAFEEALTLRAYARAVREEGEEERAAALEARAAEVLATLRGEER